MGQVKHQPDEDGRALLELLPADGGGAASEEIRAGSAGMPSAMPVPVSGWKSEGMCRPGRAVLRPLTGI